MKKADPRVKKTLVRNCKQKINKDRQHVVHDVDASSSKTSTKTSRSKENHLDQPSLCSSDALARYLEDAKRSLHPLEEEDLNIDKGQQTAEMTKKLNFHFNDRIYKNLVELNADTATMRNKKDKRPVRPNSAKKDLEPKIEDFCSQEKEEDVCPEIPVTKPKFKPVKPVENGHLHRLVASFECL